MIINLYINLYETKYNIENKKNIVIYLGFFVHTMFVNYNDVKCY